MRELRKTRNSRQFGLWDVKPTNGALATYVANEIVVKEKKLKIGDASK